MKSIVHKKKVGGVFKAAKEKCKRRCARCGKEYWAQGGVWKKHHAVNNVRGSPPQEECKKKPRNWSGEVNSYV